MATNANEILDRLAALLDAATPGPWRRQWVNEDAEEMSDAEIVTSLGLRVAIVETPTLLRGGDLDAGTLTDTDLIVALRNAAPALIRLARAALWLDNVPRHTGDHDLEIEIAKKEDDLGDALDALGEVRL